MNIFVKNKICVSMIIFSLCFLLLSCGLNYRRDINDNFPEKEIKEIVLKIMSAIEKKEVEKLFDLFPEKGVVEGDTYFTKKVAIDELLDKNSYGYNALFALINTEELDMCKKNGDFLFITPYAYIAMFGPIYDFDIVKQFPEYPDSKFYSAKLERKKVGKCTLDLLPIHLQKMDEKFYLRGFFFQMM